MKTGYKIILALAAATVMLFTVLPCGAVEKEGEDIWSSDRPRGEIRQFELTDEVIEHMMARLTEANPEKAKELEQLREKDPEKFQVELRKAMHEQFGERFRERMEQGATRKPSGWREKVRRMFGRRGKDAKRDPKRDTKRDTREIGMRDRHAEHLEWLGKNYPEEAKRLAEMREKRPELFERGIRRYRRIIEAEKENPELAKVLKEDLELKKECHKLLRKIKAAAEDEKKELIGQLEKVVGSRFDLIVRRKQMEYEQMHKQLKRLERRVQRSEAEVEKWKDAKFKNENVKARIEDLVSQSEKFDWD